MYVFRLFLLLKVYVFEAVCFKTRIFGFKIVFGPELF